MPETRYAAKRRRRTQGEARPGARYAESISLTNAKTDDVVKLWNRTAERFTMSRDRILLCRDIRRNEAGVSIDPDWIETVGDDVAEWLEVALPQRQTLDLNMTNALGEHDPRFTRAPIGTSDTAQSDADALELWGNSVAEQAIDWDAIRGLAIQEGEFGVIVLPDTAAMQDVPEYIESKSEDEYNKLKDDEKTTYQREDGETEYKRPNPRYDRDIRGRASDHPNYTKRNEKKSSDAHKDDYLDWLANHLPFTVQIVSALDCVPILVRGKRRQWECTGLIRRTLFDEEELIARKFNWKGMGERELIPRSFDSTNTYGNAGQLYLYEAYVMIEKGGRQHPTIIYSVGGVETTTGMVVDGQQQQQASVIDLYDEYGIESKLWEYFWGLHFEDDPDYRGMPYMWPMVPAITNLEGLLTADLAAAWANDFRGEWIEANAGLPPEVILEGEAPKQTLRTTTPPKTGQVQVAPGKITPSQGPRVGDGARYMEAVLTASIQETAPDPSQSGGPGANSGRQMVVRNDLLKAGKGQILKAILEAGEFAMASILTISCALKRKFDVPVPVYVNDERTVEGGETKAQRVASELNERWVGRNYKLEAAFPEEGNLAEVIQEADLYDRGLATFDDVQKKRGNASPMTTRVKTATDEYWKGDLGKLELQAAAAAYRGDEEAKTRLELEIQGLLHPEGLPTAELDPALAALASGQSGGALLGGMPPGQAAAQSPAQVINPAESARAGQISGEVGMGPLVQDEMMMAGMR